MYTYIFYYIGCKVISNLEDENSIVVIFGNTSTIMTFLRNEEYLKIALNPERISMIMEQQPPKTMWDELCKWLFKHKDLKGARLIIQAMDISAENAIFDNHNFDLSHHEGSEGDSSLNYPVFEQPIEMTDQKALSDCRKREEYLERQDKYNRLTDSEREELEHLRKYLSETTHNGRIKQFPSGLSKMNKSNGEAVKYALKKLEREEPALAQYAREHLCLRDFVKWKE